MEGSIAPQWREMVSPRWGEARGGSRAVGGVWAGGEDYGGTEVGGTVRRLPLRGPA